MQKNRKFSDVLVNKTMTSQQDMRNKTPYKSDNGAVHSLYTKFTDEVNKLFNMSLSKVMNKIKHFYVEYIQN